MLNFEQAWNVIQAVAPARLGGVSAADAARGLFGDHNAARDFAGWIRATVKLGQATTGHVVARGRLYAGILQGSDEAAALAAAYEARNRAKG